MTDATAPTPSPQQILADGVVQLRFADDANTVHAINAAEVAEVLQGLVEFTDDMAKRGLFGDGMPPEVRVRPVKEGSFVVEAILAWAGANPEAAIGSSMTVGGGLIKAVDIGLKRLRGNEPTDFEHLENGNVKIKWRDGSVDEVPLTVWDQIKAMKRRTKRALRKLMAPLSDQADTLELRDASIEASTEDVLALEPASVAHRSDYREAAAEAEETREDVENFVAEGSLESIDFRPGQKWRVSTSRGTRLATIEDEEFLRDLDRGTALHKNDVFEVTIREVRTTTTDRNVKTEWFLTNARRTRRGSDDGDASASQSE
ncbi:hypothetical protein [Clavibacter nebraskensis]|uniref:hypothetical protein n=1 Tax=Clavibacter nebraskensis TaxID=31963 RepID=UPI003F87D07F